MKNFKKLALESKYYKLLKENNEDEDLDSFDQDKEENNNRLIVHHAIVDGKTALMHMEKIPFSYTAANGKKLIFDDINHAASKLAHSMSRLYYSSGVLVPNDNNVNDRRLKAKNINDRHYDILNSLLKTHMERSRELYRRDELFRTSVDFLASNYKRPHDDIYSQVFSDHYENKHLVPKMEEIVQSHSDGGEEGRARLGGEINDSILQFGGTMGALTHGPNPPRIENIR